MSLTGSRDDAEVIEMRCGVIQFGPACHGKRDVVKAAAGLVETVTPHGTQPDQGSCPRGGR